MALDLSNSSNAEQLALKGLTHRGVTEQDLGYAAKLENHYFLKFHCWIIIQQMQKCKMSRGRQTVIL